jgi:putative tricarboxylic transport membrane protein
MWELALQALVNLFTPINLLFTLLGIGMGLIVGILPGLGGIAGLSVLLPFVYGMQPDTAIAMMVGLTAITTTSDTFASVLLGVPGSSSSQATIMDGYPLAKQGQASRALSAAFTASAMGGIFGAGFLFAIVMSSRSFLHLLGSPELFMLALLGLSMVGLLAGRTPMKGVLVGLLGIVIGTIGAAPGTAFYRFTFGELYLWDGIPLAPVALGLFAVPEFISLLESRQSIAKSEPGKSDRADWLRGTRETFVRWKLVLANAFLGSFLGAVPGLGGTVIDWISYGLTSKSSRDRDKFGTGIIDGVIAPESANNAKEGGALIPTLLFGIPGSGSTAILLGGLIMVGIQPGPQMLITHLPITLTVIWTLAFANLVGTTICVLLSRQISRLTFIPGPRLVPFLLVAITLAVYQTSNSWGDVLVLIGFSALGILMRRFAWPRAPMIIGIVLAAPAERYLYLSVQRYGWDWIFRPGALTIGMVILLASIVASGLLDRFFGGGSGGTSMEDYEGEHAP